MQMTRSLADILRALRRDRRSNVALIYLVWSIPLLIFMAVAMNFGYATLMKQQLDSAADSAVLLATTYATNTLQAGGTTPSAAASAASSVASARFSSGRLRSTA